MLKLKLSKIFIKIFFIIIPILVFSFFIFLYFSYKSKANSPTIIRGKVFLDQNNNQLYDNEDNGVPSSIEIYDAYTNELISTTFTDQNNPNFVFSSDLRGKQIIIRIGNFFNRWNENTAPQFLEKRLNFNLQWGQTQNINFVFSNRQKFCNNNSPFLGIGGHLTPQELQEIGASWIYTWSADANLKSLYGNKYIPMLHKCDDTQLNEVLNWPTQGDYLLFLNEPESLPETRCLPSKAAQYFKKIKENRPDLKILVAGNVQLGEGWGIDSREWLRQFGEEYRRLTGRYPETSGLHIHIYPKSQDFVNSLSIMKKDLDTWINFQNQTAWLKEELWITETGAYRQPRNFSKKIMLSWIRYLRKTNKVNRVAWFIAKVTTQPDIRLFGNSSLMINNQKTELWQSFIAVNDKFSRICENNQQTFCNKSNQGDANCDNKINGIDYTVWLKNQCRVNCPASNLQKADFNNDGKVDDADYEIWFGNRQ